MTILTVGQSPHLNTSLSKLHRDFISGLKTDNHIETIATLHDISFFLPNQSGIFEYDGAKIHPFLDDRGALSAFCINVMKNVQPNIVITFGERKEHNFMSVLKSFYPNLFKWIAVVTTVGPFSSDIYELNLADAIVVTNKAAYASLGINSITNTKIFYNPVGVDDKIFALESKNRKFSATYVCRNTLESNPGVFINTTAKSHIGSYLHSNIDDNGDYNLERLISQCGAGEYVSLPNNFVSVKEGLPDKILNDIYNAHFLVLDCSMQSKTGVSMIEGMLSGCVPVGPNFGAVGDIIESLPEEYRFFVPYEKIMWYKEEEAAVVSEEGLMRVFKEIKHKFMNDKDWRKNAAQKMREMALNFSKENFIQRTKRIIESVAGTENAILVDSY